MASTQERVLDVGSIFAGRYRIRRLLGEGDRKRTYLADDTVFPREVALALIKPTAAADDPEGTRREVQALAKAGTNENIVTLHDSGTVDDIEYLVFDYLRGGTLREYMTKRAERNKPLSVEEVMRTGRRLARALAYVHGLGLIHRDVAPGNVWLDERQLAHLGDFDSVISRDAARHPDALPPTTEAYAAPEQLDGGPFDERSDLYSLGAILYEALTNERPEPMPRAAIAKHLTASRPDLPRSLRDVVCSLLAKSPDERPASAERVLDALEPAHVYRTAEEGLVPWAETLPFPLASILWQFEGELNEGIQVEYLLKFFEALAQFAATVLLSACASDHELFDANRSAWFDGNGHRALNMQRAAFGEWMELTERLAATLRAVLEADGGRGRFGELFKAADLELAESLTDTELTAILRHAWSRRNNWLGHGGVAGQQVQSERLRELNDLLVRTRKALGWSFETWTLLKPGQMTRSGKIFDLTAKILEGTNPVFRRQQLKLSEALDTTRLYMLNEGNLHALELVPFIRVLAGSMGQEACYFYNRIEGDEVRWVSYHFQAEPELLLPGEDVIEFLATLNGPDATEKKPGWPKTGLAGKQEWDWDRYAADLGIPADRLDLSRVLVDRLSEAIAKAGLPWQVTFRKGYIAFQRAGGYNTLLVDLWWRQPVRLAIRLPENPAALSLTSPYPDLEESWRDYDGEWGWWIPSAAAIPDLRPAIEIAARVHPASGPASRNLRGQGRSG
jgi:serine/threonine protein kinase